MAVQFTHGAVLAPVVVAKHTFDTTGNWVPECYTVSVVTEIREPKKAVRQAVHHMTPAMARRRAAELLRAASEAEAMTAAL
ncbi:hypothetical protein RB625_19710 [Streptomyces californicus]|uniref:hypothetical protein n=1 Tax=Streptomyces californicus TaxID=67351 RepID=UPI00296ECC11|nr:hypothetical protein [Streptomyces californicus]MDW4900639.1 hypothetical protein [Streptomyces californicus]